MQAYNCTIGAWENMAGTRRSFKREGEAQRREDLISAALDCIAEGGTRTATVRAIADRAGVTPGLIRHYFRTKEDLLGEAYQTLMARMTDASLSVLTAAPGDPLARLAAFVEAAVTPPVVDPRAMALWAGFIHMVQNDPATRAVHQRTYLGFRDQLQALIVLALSADGRVPDDSLARSHAIACNALIDGIWLEGSALPDAFAENELPRIALTSVGLILGLQLIREPS